MTKPYLLFSLTLSILLSFHSHGNAYTNNKKEKLLKISQHTSQLSRIKKKYKYIYLRANQVNLRAGPSTKYPINWVIRKKGEPLKFLTSFYQWIKVQNINGHQGWLQVPMITTKYMYGVIVNKNHRPITAYAMANLKSRKVVKLEPGVRVRVLKCIENKWCKIRVNKFKAWITSENLWGHNT